MKILLINPPRNKAQTQNYGYTFSPALACLSAMLKENGYSPKILDLFDSHDWKSISQTLRAESPDLVGMTCLTNTRQSVARLASILKGINDRAIVVVGGAHPTVLYEQVLNNYAVDAVVIGEGDVTILNLARAIEGGNPLDDVKGIAFKRDGRIMRTEPQPLIKDLDSLPRPDYYHLDCHADGRSLNTGVAIGRGCPYNCQFCASSSVWGNSYRTKSIARVVDEIAYVLSKSKDNVIFIGDDMIGVTEADAVSFCEEILTRDLNFRWYANARVDSVTERILRLMKQAGCMMICYGVESGSPKILKTINKRITVEEVKRAFRLTHEIGIECQATIMVGNPGEDAGTIKQTEGLLKEIEPDYVWISYATIYPGTALCELAEEQGLIDESYWLSDLVAPTYAGSMSLGKMFYHKWRMNLSQARRKREVMRFARGFASEISPQRLYEGLNLARRHGRGKRDSG